MRDVRLEVVHRSMLFMPVNVPRFLESAWRREADAVILDLEDSVPPAKKEEARGRVRGALPLAARGGAEAFVRVNNHPDHLAAGMTPIHPFVEGFGCHHIGGRKCRRLAQPMIKRLDGHIRPRCSNRNCARQQFIGHRFDQLMGLQRRDGSGETSAKDGAESATLIG